MLTYIEKLILSTTASTSSAVSDSLTVCWSAGITFLFIAVNTELSGLTAGDADGSGHIAWRVGSSSSESAVSTGCISLTAKSSGG